MKTRWIGLWCIVCSWSVSGQPLTHDRLTGTWIGVHTEVGPDAYCPLPTYLGLQPDGTYRLGAVDGSVAPRLTTWSFVTDTLRLGTLPYAPGLVSLLTDTLRIGTVYPMTFRRFYDMPIDSATTHNTLLNRVWQTDSLAVHFHENGIVCLEDRTTRQRTVHHWRLARFGQSVFVLIQGSQHTTDGHYKPLWQLVATAAGQFQAVGWNGQRVSTETFRLVRSLSPGDVCQPTGFQACDNCFSQRSVYYITSFLPVSSRYIAQTTVRQYFKPLALAGESGLIRVRFVLNCAGEMGLFTLREVDDDYCPRPFDHRITRQLVAICQQQLPRALTAGSGSVDEGFDRDITLNFRLKDGYLIDIFP